MPKAEDAKTPADIETLLAPALKARLGLLVETMHRSIFLLYLHPIILQRKFHLLVKLYMQYRNDPSAQRKLATLRERLTHASLDGLWHKVLQQETFETSRGTKQYRAFHNAPALKRHRTKNQDENTADGRHPFDILAGAYYAQCTVRRLTILDAFDNAKTEIAQGHFQAGFDIFQMAIPHFYPKTDADKTCLELIKTQMMRLIAVGNLAEPARFADVKSAFDIIQTHIETIRTAQNRDLEAGEQFGDFACMKRAQYSDLQLLYSSNNNLKPLSRMIQRTEKTEQLHGTAGYLLSAKTYSWITSSFAQYAKAMQLAHPTLLHPMVKSCAVECSRFTPQDLRTLTQYRNFHAMQQLTIKAAVTKAHAAQRLQTSAQHDAITHNALGTKGIGKLLRINGEKFDSIPDLRDHLAASLTAEHKASCLTEGDNMAEQHCEEQSLLSAAPTISPT